MDGFRAPLSESLELHASKRNLLMDSGKPPDVYRHPAQCVLEELVIYGVPAGGQPSSALGNGLEAPHSAISITSQHGCFDFAMARK